jgi:hypothetical protein
MDSISRMPPPRWASYTIAGRGRDLDCASQVDRIVEISRVCPITA